MFVQLLTFFWKQQNLISACLKYLDDVLFDLWLNIIDPILVYDYLGLEEEGIAINTYIATIKPQ